MIFFYKMMKDFSSCWKGKQVVGHFNENIWTIPLQSFYAEFVFFNLRVVGSSPTLGDKSFLRQMNFFSYDNFFKFFMNHLLRRIPWLLQIKIPF
jgi:hypothetical protein